MKTSMFILCALTFVTQVSKAEVVNVADHGILPGKDVTLKNNQGLTTGTPKN